MTGEQAAQALHRKALRYEAETFLGPYEHLSGEAAVIYAALVGVTEAIQAQTEVIGQLSRVISGKDFTAP